MKKISQETYRKKHMIQGSHLKYCRNVGGLGLAILVIGVMMLAVIWILGLLSRSVMDPEANNLLLTVGSAVTLLIIAGGWTLQKKRINRCIEYYAKRNQYSSEEIKMLDEELSGDEVVLLPARTDLRDIRAYYIITPHWIKYPLLTGYARRLVDIAAVWFDPKPFYKGAHATDHLFMVDSKGELSVFYMPESYAADIIRELTKRNKNLILSRYFQYQDENYDCQEQPEKVAELYRLHARNA